MLQRPNMLQLQREPFHLQVKVLDADLVELCALKLAGVDVKKNRECRLSQSVLLFRALFSANVCLNLLLLGQAVLDGLYILPAFPFADDPMSKVC